ncbi:kinesin motor protein cin8 [Actinomortierella ambigua]|nr:kinesin motor protein cin8 [Actinomortierella ambigua]
MQVRQASHDATTTAAPSTPPASAVAESSLVRPRVNNSTSSGRPAHSANQPSFPENKELNIQVVLRCRGRSEREQKECSPVVVTAVGGKGRQVQVPSSLGERAPSRTYTFDRVFMDSDQQCIYTEVVTPILDEVMLGYNCTIFAYGQTGTGKTYTMEGDLGHVLMHHHQQQQQQLQQERLGLGIGSGSSGNNTNSNNSNSAGGRLSSEAGIIPRTLYNLFDMLEAKRTEYSVRISFLELYNEEVKDLLAAEDDRKEIKIFDVTSRKGGPLVQGLDEVAILDARQGIEALRRGSLKRTVAATKSNEKSSRSHSIFAITVHIKEVADDGEELLKIGKMNLVDLAGSENIARSGAESVQAREAGRINQSLLTLGRVINSLVERSQHIPYRESKLTRLLEDSLGGKTKTSIIATISPARSSLEETISTLNYASRAKSIKNTPEINQRMTKKTLIKEYLLEIDRLKADLQATREKNGVWLRPEEYERLKDESQSDRDMVSEVSKQLERTQKELRRVEEQFTSNLELLSLAEDKLTLAQDEIAAKKAALEQLEKEIAATKKMLEEETILRKAHAETEKELNAIAMGLRSTLSASVKDIHGLHEKLDRTTAVERENRRAFREFQARLQGLSSELQGTVDGYGSRQTSLIDAVTKSMQRLSESSLNQGRETEAFLEDQLTRMRSATEDMDQLETTTKQEADGYRESLVSMQQETVEFMSNKMEMIKQSSLDGFDTLRTTLEEYSATMKAQQQAMTQSVMQVIEESGQYANETMTAVNKHLQEFEQTTLKEVEQLRKHNRDLQERLKTQQEQAEVQKEALLASIGDMVTGFLATQTESLVEHLGRTQQETTLSLDRLHRAHADQVQRASGMGAKRQKHVDRLATAKDAFQDQKSRHLRELSVQDEHVTRAEMQVRTKMAAFVDEHGRDVQAAITKLGTTSTSQLDRLGTRSLELSRARSAFSKLSEVSTTRAKEQLKAGNKHIDEAQQAVTGTMQESSTALTSFTKQAMRSLDETQAELGSLVSQRIKQVVPTAQTPRRKEYRYPESWSLTRPKKDLLREFREISRVSQDEGEDCDGHETFADAAKHMEEGQTAGAAVVDQAYEGEEPVAQEASSGPTYSGTVTPPALGQPRQEARATTPISQSNSNSSSSSGGGGGGSVQSVFSLPRLNNRPDRLTSPPGPDLMGLLKRKSSKLDGEHDQENSLARFTKRQERKGPSREASPSIGGHFLGGGGSSLHRGPNSHTATDSTTTTTSYSLFPKSTATTTATTATGSSTLFHIGANPPKPTKPLSGGGGGGDSSSGVKQPIVH